MVPPNPWPQGPATANSFVPGGLTGQALLRAAEFTGPTLPPDGATPTDMNQLIHMLIIREYKKLNVDSGEDDIGNEDKGSMNKAFGRYSKIQEARLNDPGKIMSSFKTCKTLVISELNVRPGDHWYNEASYWGGELITLGRFRHVGRAGWPRS